MIQASPRQTENLSTTRSVLEAPQLKSSEQIVDLPIADIRTNGGTHAREKLDEHHVQDLEEVLTQEQNLDPVDVFWDSSDYWLSDGFHRIEAYNRAGRTVAKVRIQQGSQREAILHGIEANAKHKTLKWSRQDRQRAIERLLRDPEWHQWSDNAIAQLCGVDHKTVTQRRIVLGIPKSDIRVGSDGRVINTKRIGESNKTNKTSKLAGESDPSTELKEALNGDRSPAFAPELQDINEDQHIAVEPSQWAVSKQAHPSLDTHYQSRIKTTRPNNRRQRTEQEKEPFIVKPKTVKSGEWWMLGKNNFLYCGDPASKDFQKHLPMKVALLLRVVSTSDQWTQPLPTGTVSGLALFSPNEGEPDLSIFRGMVEQAVDLYTDPGDAVVLAYLPDPSIFALMEELESVCFCAEPDSKRCGKAISTWALVTKQPSEKLNRPPVVK